jgi:molybdopterin-guanine dinucleotide biosynthesis protein A
MSFNRIFILTGPIQTGKSSQLLEWSKQTKSVAGLLSLVQHDKRNLFDLNTNTFIEFEVDSNTFKDPTQQIGKFSFSLAGFEKGIQCLKNALNSPPDFLILDEIGKLEIEQNIGFHSIALELIHQFKKPGSEILLLVIRDTLLEKAVEKYDLQNAIVLHKNDLLSLNALVLAGGESNRMGLDKSSITYFEKPQDILLYDRLSAHCDKVFISLRNTFQKEKKEEFQYLIDNKEFANSGPIGALLSAIQMNPFCSWMLWACDYPLLEKSEMEMLILAAKNSNQSIALSKNIESPEPVLAIYHFKDFVALLNTYSAGNQSLFAFLKSVKCACIQIQSTEKLKSIDTPEERNWVFQIIKKHA